MKPLETFQKDQPSSPDSEVSFAASDKWAELTRLSDRIYQRGFDNGRTLINAEHEIRSLTYHPLDDEDSRYLVLAGDKQGQWYAAELDVGDDRREAPPQRTLPPIPTPGGKYRVIDDLLVAPWHERHGVVIATRGNGAWITPLKQVLGQDRPKKDPVQLQGSEGRFVNKLIYDKESRTLLATARHGVHYELLIWYLGQRNISLVSSEKFPYELTALAIDRVDEDNPEDNQVDHLYVATGSLELFCLKRSAKNACFRITARALEDAKKAAEDAKNGSAGAKQAAENAKRAAAGAKQAAENAKRAAAGAKQAAEGAEQAAGAKEPAEGAKRVWQGRLSPILQLRPLSDIVYPDAKTGKWRRRYPHRGVIATSLRHLMMLYDTPTEPGEVRCHARLVAGQTKILALGVLNLPEFEEGDLQAEGAWRHGIAVSSLEGKVRIFRPSGIRHDLSAPESKSPTIVISGYKNLYKEHEAVVPDRIYAICGLQLSALRGSCLPLLFGLGNNEVRWHRFEPRWLLRERSRKLAQEIVAEASSIGVLIDLLQAIALNSDHWRQDKDKPGISHALDLYPQRDKHTMIELIPRLRSRCESEEDWRKLFLLVWDILARRTPRYVAVSMIQALRRIQLKMQQREDFPSDELLRRQANLEYNITLIRKFVLDPGSFSRKRVKFIELATSSDPGLEEERIVYKSILISRRHDPFFLTDFDSSATGILGEVQTFIPLPPEGTSKYFWEEEKPERIRFLASNYNGELWLLDGEGDGRPLIERREEWGYIRTLYLWGDDLLLSFSRGLVRRLSWRELPKTVETLRLAVKEGEPSLPAYELLSGLDDRAIHATSFTSLPPSKEGGAERLLWGDSKGCIHLLGSDGPLFEVGTRPEVSTARSLAIQHLEGFTIRRSHGENQTFLIAATDSGHLVLLLWSESEQRLELSQMVQVGSDPISALLVAGPERRHVLVASYDTVIGLYLLADRNKGELLARLGMTWAFRTRDTVRSIQRLDPSKPDDDRVLVGSHDGHLHALDLEGRHFETSSFRQDPLRREQRPEESFKDQRLEESFKIGLFVAAPRRPQDPQYVVGTAYACAFENRFLGLRLLHRKDLIEDFNEKLSKLNEHRPEGCEHRPEGCEHRPEGCEHRPEEHEHRPEEHEHRPEEHEHRLEERLTRWRAYHVEEGHLRHRFIRQSSRYPGKEPRLILDALNRLLAGGDSSSEPTGEMTALLRRLFQNHSVDSEKGGEQRPGLRGILADRELYRDTVRLLRECESRWDTPASIANRRVQLFWIRSMLRNIEDKKMLRRWLKQGEALADEEPLAQPEDILKHFLEQTHRLIQFKTLQYVERMLFEWPGAKGGKFFQPGEAQHSDREWLLNSLLSRLRLRPDQVSRKEPNPVILQIGRLLCLLLRDHQLDPLYLTYWLGRFSVRSEMYLILADQCEALSSAAGQPRRLSEVIHDAHRLDTGLERGGRLDEIVTYLEKLTDRNWTHSSKPDADYLDEAREYFDALIPLLKVQNLKHLKELTDLGKWAVPRKGKYLQYCPSYEKLTLLGPLLNAIENYHDKKYEDPWVNPVMTHLRFEDFDRVRREWKCWRKDVEQLLKTPPPNLARREAGLIRRLLELWERILLEEEQNVALLQDFQEAVEVNFFKDIDRATQFTPEALKRVREEKQLALTAFLNLFTRLLLLGEPQEAAFLYRSEADQPSRGRWFMNGGESQPELREISVDEPLPEWIPRQWLQPTPFSELDTGIIEVHLKEHMADRSWRVTPIPGTPDEGVVLGFYIFSWADGSSPGYKRFADQRLAWAVPLQALVYRRAAVEQEELKGSLFSIVAHNLGSPLYLMRSDLKLLTEGRLEDYPSNRMEKYRQLLRQARHMDGIVNGILSLSQRDIDIASSSVSVARLIYEVVRTVRREAKVKNVTIEYPEPKPEREAETLILTDETKLYDILLNLLVNAVKYSPEDGRIFVATAMTSKAATIQITDEGPGIPPHEIERIFEPFFRGSSSQSVAGLGLGLYIAKLYAELLDGRIKVKNEPRRGVTFELFLEVKKK